MKIEIKSRFSGEVLFAHKREGNTMRITLEMAVKASVDLYGADLSGANLTHANLSGADLTRANLTGANLYGANLTGANLYGANLSGANLTHANLSGANLTHANLTGANLYGANLSDANLYGTYLYGADLYGANLSGANLSGAAGNGREVLSFVALEYRGVYTAEFMWIGCRKHPVKTWWKDSEKDAHEFTQKQIEWRAKNKRWIQAMVKNNPAIPHGGMK
jgi:uncharacterized protein YjbI with pentapeptide repeats